MLGQRRAENAQIVGEGAPHVGLPAGACLGGGAAPVESVARSQELVQTGAEHLLFVGESEVHHSPNAALARMLR